MRLYHLLLYIPFLANAQVAVKPQAIISAGTTFQNANAGVSFTVGEIVVKPMVTSDVILSNGVIESSVPFTVTKIESNRNNFQFNIFPNPSNQSATFKMSAEKDIPVFLKITDTEGRQIIGQNLPHSYNEFSFQVNKWAPGMYILNVFDQEGASMGYIKFQKL